MRKSLILALLVAAASLPAVAQSWTPLFKGDSGEHYYVQANSFQTNDRKRHVWLLIDRDSGRQQGSRSSKSYVEFDCEKERVRALQSLHYSGSLGRGRVVQIVSHPGPWTQVQPNSTMGALLEGFCSVDNA